MAWQKKIAPLGDQASSVIAPASSDSDPMSQYRAGSEIDRKLAHIGAEYLHAKVHAEQSLLPEIGVSTDDGAPVSSIEKIFGAVGPDKAVVNEMVTDQSTGMQFVNDLQTANWSDDGRSAASLFQFGPDADPKSTAQIMNAVGQASSTPEAWKLLSAIPGDHPQTVGAMNPELVRTLAKSMAPYIPDLVGAAETDGFAAQSWWSPLGQPAESGPANIFALMNTDPEASKLFNGAAYNDQLAMAAAFAHNPHNASSYLGAAGQLQRLIDKGAVTAVNSTHVEDAQKAVSELKSAAFAGRKAILDTGLGAIPGIGPYAALASQMSGPDLERLLVDNPNSSGGSAAQQALRGPEDENFRWMVLRAAGSSLPPEFRHDFPFAFDEGNLLTSEAMNAAKHANGTPVTPQDVRAAIGEMFRQFAGDSDTSAYRSTYDNMTRATESEHSGH